ncbi:MAG: hypothetical protein HY394_05820 [Candidatus Diapherotrites archaeon]|nr:hypothetical protein [Candidatus Diapherotrites archaeon]
MGLFLLQASDAIANAGSAGSAIAEKGLQLAGNPAILVAGVVLIIAAVLIFVFLKKIIVNSVAGLAVWAIVSFVFHVNLPFIPSLVISIVFGLAGIGALLLAKFLGLF